MTSAGRVTTEDLERARAELDRWTNAFANDSSNNPNKFRARIEDARVLVEDLSATLKAQGDLPMTDHEKICAELEVVAPGSAHGQVIEHGGTRYRRRFYPRRMSRSGQTVMLWGKTWESVD